MRTAYVAYIYNYTVFYVAPYPLPPFPVPKHLRDGAKTSPPPFPGVGGGGVDQCDPCRWEWNIAAHLKPTREFHLLSDEGGILFNPFKGTLAWEFRTLAISTFYADLESNTLDFFKASCM